MFSRDALNYGIHDNKIDFADNVYRVSSRELDNMLAFYRKN